MGGLILLTLGVILQGNPARHNQGHVLLGGGGDPWRDHDHIPLAWGEIFQEDLAFFEGGRVLFARGDILRGGSRPSQPRTRHPHLGGHCAGGSHLS